MRTRNNLCRTMSAFILAVLPAAAEAQYRVQPGDVLEVSVAGIPDFKQRSVVGLDGEATVPMIQPVKVAGLSLADVQSRIKDQLSRKLFQQRAVDGRENVSVIVPDAVTVTIAEFRPVYLNGDVTKPGEQVYRPGLTVRQAIALAGGYEIMRFRMNNPFLETADQHVDFDTLWQRFAMQEATIWRLQAELAALSSPAEAPATLGLSSLEDRTEAPLSKEFLDGLRANARQQLDVAVGRHRAERSFLQQAVKVADDQVAYLKARQVKDDDNVAIDVTDYEKLKDFSSRGNLPNTRLSEARRLTLFSATQSLQTKVQLTSTVRERDEAQRRIARLDETDKAEMLKRLDEAMIERDSLRSRLQGVSEKIGYTGMIRSQLTRRGGAAPQIRITHPAADGGGSEDAAEDTPVHPGDTIDVALHTETPRALR